MSKDEAVSSIKKALEELEQALEVYTQKDLEEVSRRIWVASSEAEYALFLLGISLGSEFPNSLKAKASQGRGVEPQGHMVKAQELLRSALESYGSEGDLRKLYKAVWEARGYLIELQEKRGRGLP